MTQVYGTGSNSSIGSQIRTDYYEKQALIEAAKEEVFGPLASTKEMPKNMGKKIKQYHLLPMLSDANINDQGIDASGVSTANEATIELRPPDLENTGNEWVSLWIVGNGTDGTDALGATSLGYASNTAAQFASARWKAWKVLTTAMGLDGSLAANDTYAEVKVLAEAAGWTVTENTAVSGAGNLYGSSRDVGYITGKLPTLTETGGVVNQVGFKRIELEGTFAKYGFFYSWTQESLDFDSMPDLYSKTYTEAIKGASEIQEDMIQIDLLNSAGVIVYGGTATSKATISGETGSESLLSYDDFVRLGVTLDSNRCPRNTTIVSGSRMTDTKTIPAARFMYCGPALVPQLERMVDNFGNQALIKVQHYAAGTNIMKNELGSIAGFRIIVCQEMLHWAGVGATVSNNAGYRSSIAYGQTAEKYDVYPLLVVGDQSFTTISFKSGGQGSKLNIHTAKPGSPESYANDKYGTTGFTSIQWYYGFMTLRSERIALMLTVAEI